MKLSISLLLLLSSVAHGTTPIQIHFERGQMIEATIYQELLIRDYQIPEGLISKNLVVSCENRRKQKELEICIKNNGDLLVVSADKNFIRDSLSVFRAP